MSIFSCQTVERRRGDIGHEPVFIYGLRRGRWRESLAPFVTAPSMRTPRAFARSLTLSSERSRAFHTDTGRNSARRTAGQVRRSSIRQVDEVSKHGVLGGRDSMAAADRSDGKQRQRVKLLA
jgi:hypothetical protein